MQGLGKRRLRYRLALAFAWGAIGFANAAVAADDRPVVLFLGDSLTAGYGLAAEQAFPALIQQRIDAASLGYRVVNAGVSGDTSAGGLRRVDWLLRQPIAVLVLALGGNDMLRGQGVDSMASNLRGILDRVDAARPGTRFVIAGMRAAPNLGARYTQAFEAVYAAIAADYAAPLIPFLLDGVAANRALNQPDGIHPTAAGHRVVAATVWQALAPLLAETIVVPNAGTSTRVPSDAPSAGEAR